MTFEGLPEPATVQSAVEGAVGLPSLERARGRMRALAADYARGHAQAERVPTVALVGATGAGKSTLLNALTGLPLATEGMDRPTSRTAVGYFPVGAEVGALGALLPKVERYALRPEAPWSGQVFIDTPDVNSVEARHQVIAREVLERADVALVVLHKGSVVESASARFLEPFARRRELVFVLNFADELDPASRTLLKAQTRRVMEETLGVTGRDVPIFAISAKAAQAGADVTGEWRELLATLRALGDATVHARIRRSNAFAALDELSVLASGGLEATETLRASLSQALEAGLTAMVPALVEDFARRLESTQGHLKAAVRREAASRFPGPVSVYLRLSVVGSSGVTAASLLARASLPLGLAVAAASTAFDKVQEHTRARAAERRAVEAADADGVLLPLARTALAPVRSAVQASGLSPDALGLVTPEALTERLATLRAQAWNFTGSQALAAEVSRWWKWSRWVLVPLVNLPLLGLLGDVAYRVVRAYLEHRYLGVDYFLNAGALALLLAVAGSALVSMSLGGLRRRASRAGLAHFTEAVQAWSAQSRALTETLWQDERLAARTLLHPGRAKP